MENVSDKMFDYILTLYVFSVTLAISPLLFLYFIGLITYRTLWLKILSSLNPDVEFIKHQTIRSLVDTARNQGLLTLLLTINGPAQPDSIRRHLQEVVNRQDKLGTSVFPRLKQCLVTRWGKYAWRKTNFDLNQNLIIASTTYRGRPVSEINIQDYVSDLVSKYLPASVSPWQVVVIPGMDTQHYILLRIHHTLVNEGLNIADLLPLVTTQRRGVETVCSSKSPLVEVFKKPQSIPTLMERLQEDLTNLWNEFISNYDPLEQPELLKTAPGVFQFLAIALITAVSIFKEINKGYEMVNNDMFSKIKYVTTTFNRETNRRQVTFVNYLNSIFVTLNPVNVTISIFHFYYSSFLFIFKLPFSFYQELVALYSCLTLQYCKYPHTIVGFCYNYFPLCYNCAIEILFYVKLLVRAPRTILQQILLEPETVQTIPPCGRKVIAWSRPVSRDVIQKIAKRTASSETEILLSTISVTIARYCAEAGIVTPHEIPITIRNVNSNYIFLNGSQVIPQDYVSGLIGLRLPVLTAEKDQTCLENLGVVKANFENALQAQSISYLLTILQTKYGVITKMLPNAFVAFTLKYLSKKYTISVTEITNSNSLLSQRTTWGENVTSAIYWRPPQSNMSVSLCFNQYGENITLGVMCDAQLLPYHPLLARHFSYHIEDLSMAAGIN